jgi:hypothetical protein
LHRCGIVTRWAWRQQPGTPAYGANLDKAGVAQALAKAVNHRAAEWRAIPLSGQAGCVSEQPLFGKSGAKTFRGWIGQR